MGMIRPLFLEIPRLEFELPANWDRNFLEADIGNVRIDQGLQHIGNWLRCYVEMRHIASFSASQTQVVRAIDRLLTRVTKLQNGYTPEREQSFRIATRYIALPSNQTDRARNIALDYLGNALLSSKQDMLTNSLHERGRLCQQAVHSINICAESLRQIVDHLKSVRLLLTCTAEDKTELFRKISQLVGRPIHYRVDPYMELHFRPDQDARDTLAAAMCVIYRYIGGDTRSIRRDGASNHFMKFLKAATQSLSGHHGPALESAANRMLHREKQHGAGTLEEILRFQSVVQKSASQ
jgi:hypothetical protein